MQLYTCSDEPIAISRGPSCSFNIWINAGKQYAPQKKIICVMVCYNLVFMSLSILRAIDLENMDDISFWLK